MLPCRRNPPWLSLALLVLLSLGCIVPAINQSMLRRTPPPAQGEPVGTPETRITALPDLPPLPSPVQLDNATFSQRQGTAYGQNLAHPEQECFWMGVAGQVFDVEGTPLEKIVVVIEGVLDGKEYEGIGLTGTTDAYGADSYEVVLAYIPVNSAQTLSIVLYDLRGMQLTNPLRFNTYADCTRNLIRIDFQQN